MAGLTDDEIRAAIATWPALTPEQKDRLSVLLRQRQEDTAA